MGRQPHEPIGAELESIVSAMMSHGLGFVGGIPPIYVLAPLGAITALVMAFMFRKSVMTRSEGEPEMIRIAQAVREGAMAYLTRQYKVIAVVFVLLLLFLAGMSYLGLQSSWSMAGVLVAGLFSGLCGWFGMRMATDASARTAFAAQESLNDALTVAFRSGAVMGLVVVGFALLDISLWFFIFNVFFDGMPITVLTTVMLTFGMGASTQALFARVGGGIYTKAADVGADLVGKVEAGIPEDDPRNPATIADNVGDNVGDVAGMGADLYESYYGSMLATMALGAAAAAGFAATQEEGLRTGVLLATAPPVLAGIGIFCSIAGIFTVKAKENATFAQLLKGLHKGVYVASGLIAVLAFALLWVLFRNVDLPGQFGWWGLGLSIVSGLIAGNVIALATEYYTSYEHKPTQRISQQALTGPATVIIAGVAEGMKSTWAPLATVVVAILAAYVFAGGSESFLMGLYGVGIAAVGMLSTLGITLATDAYGPIADNAGGNAEMTGQEPYVRERTDMLDSLGNTTAATGKGFAIGSAALTALALFAAFIQVVQVQIGSQARIFYDEARGQYTIPAGIDRTPANTYAVYAGHGKFAIVTDNAQLVAAEQAGDRREIRQAKDRYVDGGMIEWTRVEPRVNTNWPKMTSFPIAADTRGRSIQDSKIIRVLVGEDTTIPVVRTSKSEIRDVLAFYDVTLTNPRVLGGLFIGVLLVFLFCALTMSAVGRAAYAMMGECRRQFAAIRDALRAKGMSEEQVKNPDNWPKEGIDHQGTRYPDYASCVSISTAGAQREMVFPSILAILVPIGVGLVLSVPGVVGMLAGGLTCGFAVAIFMANAGGAWDNAKKLIESYGKITANDMVNDASIAAKIPDAVREPILTRSREFVASGKGETIVYGKGSEDHKATVVGDTVGDPFKDTSGPSLNILIKLISIVSVVFAGLTVAYGPIIGSLLGLD
ncbi:MAG: sodium-translocating pyrophosphatase [Phycisphaeraceae bacterium]|nr:MAG: sodium-translocating pyrophosphatase [Phycisphaeraceae bacterium]